MENDPHKSAIRQKLSLSGLRSNAEPISSPTSARKRELLVAPAVRHPFLPRIDKLIQFNGTENAARYSAKYTHPIKSDELYGWIKKQQLFSASLSSRDRAILQSYTYTGDTLLNNYIRGTLGDITSTMFSKATRGFMYAFFMGYYLYDQYDAFKSQLTLPRRLSLLKEYAENGITQFRVNLGYFYEIVEDNMDFFRNPDNIAPLLEAYKQDLIRIIAAAPRLTQPLTVYRGFRSEAHLRGLEYENNDFISTTLYLPKALDFSECYGPGPGCLNYHGGVYEITIDKQIPCIYMELNTLAAEEFEILLPPGLHFTFDSKIYYKNFPEAIRMKNKSMDKAVIVHATVRPIHPAAVVPYVPGGLGVFRDGGAEKVAVAEGGSRHRTLSNRHRKRRSCKQRFNVS